ncbi:MBL fold metallo-hydrolase [Candidatus Poriferisocius sp.]|uniref:MBL fold metallo-hydrolase n=1 Tax=Candidatus Poriferisocius sp. TaxID=3101276 RepID=UPI003B59BBE4
MVTLQPPEVDEIELTLLGPGRGECCVLHVGRGEWLIVDSCVTQAGHPAALAYLASLGVPSSAVRWVIATHWHDDHIRGFAELVGECSEARVLHSAALENDEFMMLAASDPDSLTEQSSGVREMWKTWTLLDNSGRDAPELVSADSRIHQRQESQTPNCEIWVLSPSSASVAEALSGFSALIAETGQPKRTIPRPKRNPSSVVVWVQVGDVIALLGADLERSSDELRGWQAIARSSGRPTKKAHLVKIPHHGSEDAHDQVMWDDLLVPFPLAGITPFKQGSANLPRDTDRARIVALTSQAWLTRDKAFARPRRRPRAVSKTIEEATRRFERLSVEPGRVTFRCNATQPEDWTVDAPSPAIRL